MVPPVFHTASHLCLPGLLQVRPGLSIQGNHRDSLSEAQSPLVLGPKRARNEAKGLILKFEFLIWKISRMGDTTKLPGVFNGSRVLWLLGNQAVVCFLGLLRQQCQEVAGRNEWLSKHQSQHFPSTLLDFWKPISKPTLSTMERRQKFCQEDAQGC